jgi:hypothetical protein
VGRGMGGWVVTCIWVTAVMRAEKPSVARQSGGAMKGGGRVL